MVPLKVLSVSISDGGGGAAIGAYRLHQGLRRSGVQSEMLVLRKVTKDPSVHRLSSHLNLWGRMQRRAGDLFLRRDLRMHPRKRKSGHWSLNLYPYPMAAVINSFAADIVHLHWVGDNFLPIRELRKIRAPIIWTLRDMWAFTGGCHYAGNCVNFREGCGNCPQLVGAAADDISARVNREKQHAWSKSPLTIVAISTWLADCARQSSLLKNRRIEVIGNPIDPTAFKPLDRVVARSAFNLPPEKKLILFGAVGGISDPRKGFAHLREALEDVTDSQELELVTFGAEAPEDLALDLPCHQIGRLQDEVSLSLLYSACDVYVLPTLQEALGKTLMEALACGTPCVTFDGSGASDVVQHQQSGYVARSGDSLDLFTGIEWVLAQSWSRQGLHEGIVERYGVEGICEQYVRLYRSVLGENR